MAPSPSPRRGYRWIPLFSGVEEDLLARRLERCEVRRLGAGTDLLRPGEPNDTIYVLLSGELMVYLSPEARSDQRIPVAVGECIGEFSAIDQQPVSALVRCEREAGVLCLQGPYFWRHLVPLPGVARNLMRGLTQRARTANRLTLEALRERLELEHLRRELDLARQIQSGMLPLAEPLFPEREDLEVCGLVEPAASVGGDLFDAFFVADGRLFVCIGDVSGHGVSAALLMARTIGLLRSLAMNAGDPAALLQNLNASLCDGNETSLFVTLFCGFLDPATGRLVYSNAGHCPPLLVTGGQVADLPLPRGPLAGVFRQASYANSETQLQPGDLLFSYTDGITEAENAAGQPFGLAGCEQLLRAHHHRHLPEILDAIRSDLHRFNSGADLDDDCTLLLLRRC
ncbi:PP2C family protein-serine/threonine phosphatase [Cyanobium sp. CH-040]|uniref:PP2C family protein-serine/threonine phosphatase n=1 Tax=Cyanobium sp. CH-040 TaxID=2823708 RepID=UPI0020CF0B01|nr:SpoIIE family protein phosphatase [Cyanobium sp. CH-040]MCP9928200.1 SpoIIE family protein phosphatase [Cyanobium sp. CH-040]